MVAAPVRHLNYILMEENNRQFKGIWMPAEIWLNHDLTWNEKILLAEIDSFTSRDRDFYMSNEYIANFLGVTETSANKILSSLIKKGFVVKTKFDGRKRWVKSALSTVTSQGCSQEQGRDVPEDNRYNKDIEQDIFGVDKSTPNARELDDIELTNDELNLLRSTTNIVPIDKRLGKRCETIAKSTRERCLRTAIYSVNGRYCCGQHARESIKDFLKANNPESWRTDYKEYRRLVDEGAAALKRDISFRKDVERLQPNVDYDKTIDSCVSKYWGTEEAWERKRRARTKTINMKATLRQNFDKNRIYKERQASYSGGSRPRDVDTHNVNDQWGDIVAEQMRRIEEEKRRNA